VRRSRRRAHRRLAARIGRCGAARDGAPVDPGARTSRATSEQMRPFTSTISLEEARARLDAALRPITRVERVALEDAAGRVAARDVVSPIDVPPFARSA